ncbi:MAG TPA: DoxX-like family protein [Pirellulaceae bacterium]|nr:DoxX-like family protein [Pirellulaceae bacterium]
METRIRAPLDELWRLTQSPDLHARWDLRFTRIQYLPRLDEYQPQRFLYATRIGCGWAIEGAGETVGQRCGEHGERASALKFWSDDPKSLIREGAGYWRYVPADGSVRFFTSFDYRVRFGALGQVIDTALFRPLIGWATAWSFDSLRLWLEKGLDPATSRERSLIHLMARAALAFVWIYQGTVPKLLTQNADELAMLQQTGLSAPDSLVAIQVIGWAEVAFGLLILLRLRDRWPLVLTILLMLAATVSVALSSPHYLTMAFNPISLNLLMVAVAAIEFLVSRDLPSASHCLRVPSEDR